MVDLFFPYLKLEENNYENTFNILFLKWNEMAYNVDLISDFF
jgi:hypothetical protein